MASLSSLLLFALSISRPLSVHSSSVSYLVNEHFRGNNFYDNFVWETFDDPTHGRVNYVDQQTAQNTNLSFASESKFVMRADAYQVVPSYNRGRDSVRISSKSSWDEFLMIIDLTHMPQGCTTWPAFWTVSQPGPWPQGGEIDIIEGVNLNSQNLVSLHTTSDCMMPPDREQSGTPVSTNCDAAVNYNQGCGTVSVQPNSYGQDFNSNGGGWFAMEKSKTAGVSVWFWPRNDECVPNEVRDNDCLGPISTDGWGKPDALFPTGENCDYGTHFNSHSIVFDLTFCGDWAGSAFGTSSCGSMTCEDFVNNNPDKFKDAYWEINSLSVYTPVP